jgi:serine/threonine-protein kinase
VSQSGEKADDPQIGRSYGHYQVVRLLGSGGMGAVYEAEQPRIGKRVAIKVLHPHVARVPEALRRFFHEARLVNQIRHAHLIDVLDFGEDDAGIPYLVMELLEGESLKTRLSRGPLQESEARHIGVQVARALDAAHAIGAVHRDLKPDNIFLCHRDDDESFVKLLDFGIAKLLGDEGAKEKLTRDGAVMGTPLYMAPEQVRGTGIGPATDIYALGCILHEMVVGKPPFNGSMLALINSHLNEAPPRLSTLGAQVSLQYEQITSTCLAKPIESRYARAIDVAEALGRSEFSRTRNPSLGQPPAPVVQTAPLAPSAPSPTGGPTSSNRSAVRLKVADVEALATTGVPAVVVSDELAASSPSPGSPSATTPATPATPAGPPPSRPADLRTPAALVIPPTRALRADEIGRHAPTERIERRVPPLRALAIGAAVVVVAFVVLVVALTRGPAPPPPGPRTAELPGTPVTGPEEQPGATGEPGHPVEQPHPPAPSLPPPTLPPPTATRPPAPHRPAPSAPSADHIPAGTGVNRTEWHLVSSSCPRVFAPHTVVTAFGNRVVITAPGYATMNGVVTGAGAFTVTLPGVVCQGQVVGQFSSEVCQIGNQRCSATYKQVR